MTSFLTTLILLTFKLTMTQEQQLVSVDDFHITNPLFNNSSREIHGWEIDGLVKTEKETLTIGGPERGQYIVKSFIPILSKFIEYATDLKFSLIDPSSVKDAKNKKVDQQGFFILQIYPENKIEINNGKEIKVNPKGVNFIFEKDGPNGLKVSYFESLGK